MADYRAIFNSINYNFSEDCDSCAIARFKAIAGRMGSSGLLFSDDGSVSQCIAAAKGGSVTSVEDIKDADY